MSLFRTITPPRAPGLRASGPTPPLMVASTDCRACRPPSTRRSKPLQIWDKKGEEGLHDFAPRTDLHPHLASRPFAPPRPQRCPLSSSQTKISAAPATFPPTPIPPHLAYTCFVGPVRPFPPPSRAHRYPAVFSRAKSSPRSPQWTHQAYHRPGHSVVCARDHGHKRVYQLHHVPG